MAAKDVQALHGAGELHVGGDFLLLDGDDLAGQVDVRVLALRGGCGALLGLAGGGGLGGLALRDLLLGLLLGLGVVGLGLLLGGETVKDGGGLGDDFVGSNLLGHLLTGLLAGLALLGGGLDGLLDDAHDVHALTGGLLGGRGVFLLLAEALGDGGLHHLLEVVCAHLEGLAAGSVFVVHSHCWCSSFRV